jgi:hypothetical protein
MQNIFIFQNEIFGLIALPSPMIFLSYEDFDAYSYFDYFEMEKKTFEVIVITITLNHR